MEEGDRQEGEVDEEADQVVVLEGECEIEDALGSTMEEGGDAAGDDEQDVGVTRRNVTADARLIVQLLRSLENMLLATPEANLQGVLSKLKDIDWKQGLPSEFARYFVSSAEYHEHDASVLYPPGVERVAERIKTHSEKAEVERIKAKRKQERLEKYDRDKKEALQEIRVLRVQKEKYDREEKEVWKKLAEESGDGDGGGSSGAFALSQSDARPSIQDTEIVRQRQLLQF